jgi:hypothetical protein
MLVPKMIKLTEYSNKAEKPQFYINVFEISEIKGNKATGFSVHMKNGNAYKITESAEHLLSILQSLDSPDDVA